MRENWERERHDALSLFKRGYGCEAVAKQMGISRNTVRKWLYTYRAIGEEALFMSSHKTYDLRTKIDAARAVLEDGLSVQEAMIVYGIKSPTQIRTWCKAYREGGADALKPKPKGRPRKHPKAYMSREEELEARVQELELELEIQKRINALADELNPR